MVGLKKSSKINPEKKTKKMMEWRTHPLSAAEGRGKKELFNLVNNVPTCVRIVTLLTDFGAKDHYVASIKGAILCVNPRCTIVDISNEVKPQDIREGAFILAGAFHFFPERTIHLGVVDPGVGGPRRPILIETENYFFVGPDNGLLSVASRQDGIKEIFTLTESRFFRPEVSQTFHGRDLFGPVAGHLALGVRPKAFGKRIDSLIEIDSKKPEVKGGTMTGEVLHIDRFGNLITNIIEKEFYHFVGNRAFQVWAGNRTINGLKKGYWEGKRGEVIALIGSGGFLEIAVREGSAGKRLKLKRGDQISISVTSGQ
jgi:S-adenosylmethionine hydrolase